MIDETFNKLENQIVNLLTNSYFISILDNKEKK